ncbi:MAG: thymidylate synthase [Alphaproteobacteria bacterium CG_4_10_14_0_2_um_filter_63_37]|nr:MAG: hypothetical protein AUJ55_01145 [Proteobacteria bacterium CG1_02_64_396]PJA25822.1 MAG: thymidylate synthase [Alphaproteobacteria bacterium CG_4_10_14_0_2_um_filter_63_37]
MTQAAGWSLKVRILSMGPAPFAETAAAARSCYSARPVLPEGLPPERWGDLLASIIQAGHHTTLAHTHITFLVEGLSRHCIWAFLHRHPFYNSEQVSQRYVAVAVDAMAVPPGLPPAAANRFRQGMTAMMAAYQTMTEALRPAAHAQWSERFPPKRKGFERDVGKRAMESARYLLPLAVTAHLHHTVSLLTLMRLHAAAPLCETPDEAGALTRLMVEAVIAIDPEIARFIPGPVARDPQPEVDPGFVADFDARLGKRTSLLVHATDNGDRALAEGVRAAMGQTQATMSDVEAIAWGLDPARNPLLGLPFNLTEHDARLTALHHVHYTFHKKLSHTADSQNQRHRMTPATRPRLVDQVGENPETIDPSLLAGADEAVQAEYRQALEAGFVAWREVLALGGDPLDAAYLLPNAVAVRMVESGDLAALRHKMAMRLCFNAQEEIWRAAVEEAVQIGQRHPEIGKLLLPPCTIRDRAGVRPLCPEGERYCGVPVWKYEIQEWERVI